MAEEPGIECRECGGTNAAGSVYCWYCGARLPRWHLGTRGKTQYLRAARIVAKGVLSLALLAAVAFGLYYAAERLLFPLFHDHETTPQTVLPSAISSPSVTSTSSTTTEPRVVRSIPGGEDRYATAVAFSRLGFAERVPGVALIPGDDFVPGMCAAPLAFAYGGPVLLVPPTGLRPDMEAELKRLDPGRVFLVGLSRTKRLASQLQSLLDKAKVTTLTGSDQYETAVLVAQELQRKVGPISGVVIVPSDSFLEAAAVAPLAAVQHWPMLLTRRDAELPQNAAHFLGESAATAALVVGSQTEVDLSQVESKQGENGHATAAAVADYAATHGLDFAHVCIATGDSFPDAIVMGTYAAAHQAVLLFAEKNQLPAAAQDLLAAHLPEVRIVEILALPTLAKELATQLR